MCRSVQPVQNRYNPIYTENTEKVASNLKWKTLGYNVLEKITVIALIAIMGTVFAISFGVGAGIAGLSTTVFVAVLSTPFLSMGLSRLHAKTAALSLQRDMVMRIANKIREISRFTDEQIFDRLENIGIQRDQLPLQMLSQINSQSPVRALIPLLARYEILEAERTSAQQKVSEGLTFILEAQSDNGRAIALEARRSGWRRLENHEIPASMTAALMLQIMLNPTTQVTSLKSLGSFSSKDFDERIWDRQFANNDDYFAFKAQQTLPLQFGEVCESRENLLHPKSLPPIQMRGLLFDTHFQPIVS